MTSVLILPSVASVRRSDRVFTWLCESGVTFIFLESFAASSAMAHCTVGDLHYDEGIAIEIDTCICSADVAAVVSFSTRWQRMRSLKIDELVQLHANVSAVNTLLSLTIHNGKRTCAICSVSSLVNS